jgi:hypothetical protein
LPRMVNKFYEFRRALDEFPVDAINHIAKGLVDACIYF